MAGRRSLGRRFGWLWMAYSVSALGTGVAFGAFPLIAIIVLHAGPAEVAALAAAGLAVGAAVAVPLGPWVEFRRKRPVMMAMDLTRFAALVSIPAAFACGGLSFAQLLIRDTPRRVTPNSLPPAIHSAWAKPGTREPGAFPRPTRISAISAQSARMLGDT